MDEGILAAVLRLDEPIALVEIEEFDGSDGHGTFPSRCGEPPISPPVLGEAVKEEGAAKRQRPSVCDW
jgi:hypothetical protein